MISGCVVNVKEWAWGQERARTRPLSAGSGLEAVGARVPGRLTVTGSPALRVKAGSRLGRDRRLARAERERRQLLARLRDTMPYRGRAPGSRRPLGCRARGLRFVSPGRSLLVVDPSGVDDDLVRDVTEIPIDLCARRRGGRPGPVRFGPKCARKQKGSANPRKSAERLSRLHARIAGLQGTPRPSASRGALDRPADALSRELTHAH
jgi:hypothetical protein